MLVRTNSIVILLLQWHSVHTEPEKPEKWAVFTKSQGKPVIIMEFFVILIKVREYQLFSSHIVCINSFYGCSQSISSSSCYRVHTELGKPGKPGKPGK